MIKMADNTDESIGWGAKWHQWGVHSWERLVQLNKEEKRYTCVLHLDTLWLSSTYSNLCIKMSSDFTFLTIRQHPSAWCWRRNVDNSGLSQLLVIVLSLQCLISYVTIIWMGYLSDGATDICPGTCLFQGLVQWLFGMKFFIVWKMKIIQHFMS